MQNSLQNNWEKVKLGEVAEITSSKRIFANEYLKTGIPFYRGKEIIEKFNGNDVSTDLFISKEKYNDIEKKFGVPQTGDMLLSSVGTLGIPYLVGDNERFYFKDGNLTWFRSFHGIDNRFLFYWIQSNVGKAQLVKHIIGSSQQALTIDGLKKMEIVLPLMEEQQKISSLLSSFDDKIELNNKISKTLEEMAQAIFKEWFINFRFPGFEKVNLVDSKLGKIPEGWEINPFREVIDILSGGTPSTSSTEYWTGSIPFFTPADTIDSFYCINTAKSISEKGLEKCNSSLFSINTIFITARGTVGKVILSGAPMAMNQSCYALKGKTNISSFYVFLLMKKLVKGLKNEAVGGVFDTITVSTFEHININVPPKYLLEEFDHIILPLFNQILTIQEENQKLAALRDLLLPKLMKGEIKA